MISLCYACQHMSFPTMHVPAGDHSTFSKFIQNMHVWQGSVFLLEA